MEFNILNFIKFVTYLRLWKNSHHDGLARKTSWPCGHYSSHRRDHLWAGTTFTSPHAHNICDRFVLLVSLLASVWVHRFFLSLFSFAYFFRFFLFALNLLSSSQISNAPEEISFTVKTRYNFLLIRLSSEVIIVMGNVCHFAAMWRYTTRPSEICWTKRNRISKFARAAGHLL